MADKRELQILLTLKDQATKELNKVQGKLKDMAPTFKKMSVIGVASLGAVTVGLNKALKEAALAEGGMIKFNTVFGDGKEDMLDFVNSIRKEFPAARSDIIRMAADLQDLLIPMGLTREKGADMSKEFLDIANKVSAFNDVDPSRVLDAIKSGLVGSSEPLRAFGVDARITTLEATALKEGLIEAGDTFANLDPEIRSVVQAEALLIQVTKQSSDAIEGFEENNDSLLRRQQDLQATLKETREAIGTALIPIIDELIKKILPVVKVVSEWIEENPRLTKIIIAFAVGLTALLAVVGLLGLALPAIIAGFALLFSPITLLIIIIGLLVFAIIKLVKKFKSSKEDFKIIWEAIQEFFSQGADFIKGKIDSIIGFFQNMIDKAKEAMSKVTGIFGNVGGKISGAFGALTGRATGGVVKSGETTLVGENGPEIAQFPGGTRITPNNQMGGGGIVVNVFGDISGEELVQKVKDSFMNDLTLNERLTI